MRSPSRQPAQINLVPFDFVRLDFGACAGDATLSSIVHRTGLWSAVMISNSKNAFQYPSRTGPGRPDLIEPDVEHEPIQLCLAQQEEKTRATISDVIDYRAQK
jgi:hypothetical protein